MTVARKNLVDINVTRFYHCISQCVRQAMLCGKGYEHRKQWIEDRIEELSQAFAIAICSFAILDNHLHVLLKLEPEQADDWSDEEIIRRWMLVYSPSGVDLDNEQAVQAHVEKTLKEKKDMIEEYRQRLTNLSWFMKRLKEPISRQANEEDNCKGAFWAARFKSIAVLDDEALLATSTYIDLNSVAAGIDKLPETSRHTSIGQRINHVLATEQGKETLEAARETTTAALIEALGQLEEKHWLCPIHDRSDCGAERAGMLQRLSLASYLELIDYTSRVVREGKANVGQHVCSLFERLGLDVATWDERLKLLRSRDRLIGNYFATDRSRLRELAAQRGCNRLFNLGGCQG